jgi:hypothetical protein
VAIQRQVLGGLITALVTGSVTDILIGCYLVVPLAIAVLVSLAGLIWQAAAAPSPTHCLMPSKPWPTFSNLVLSRRPSRDLSWP